MDRSFDYNDTRNVLAAISAVCALMATALEEGKASDTPVTEDTRDLIIGTVTDICKDIANLCRRNGMEKEEFVGAVQAFVEETDEAAG